MAEKQAPAPQRATDFQPLSDFERRIRERILGQDLPGIPQEFLLWLTSQLELQPPAIIANQLSGLPAAINDYLPWLIDINVYPTAIQTSSFDTITADTACIGAGTKDSAGNQDNLIGWDILLPAGTWSLELMHKQGADRGIYTVAFAAPGVSLSFGTIDGYNAATTRNVRSSLTGAIVTAPTKGRLSLAMSTKNASSSKYTGSIQAVRLWRTA